MKFIIISDTKGKEKGINEKVLKKLLTECKKSNFQPEFMVLCGDNVAGSSDKKILITQLQRLEMLIYEYYPNILLLPVVGNHEVNNEPIDDSYEKIFYSSYGNFLPNTCLEGYNKTVYYADFNNTRLIVLNSFHFGELNIIGEKQLKWLLNAASAQVKNKIVFVHSPAFPTGAHYGHCLDLYPEFRDAFWGILEKCNIDVVFSGHEHNYSRRKIKKEKEIYQIITGGGGEKLRDKYKSNNGVIIAPIAKFHYTAVEIEGNHIKISAFSSEGKLLDEFQILKN